jgi:hypothetical protein
MEGEMNKAQRQFWGPYIELIGENNIRIEGMMVKSKFYCGMDISQSQDAEKYGVGTRNIVINRYNEYQEIVGREVLKLKALQEIFMSYVQAPFYDTELVNLINNYKLDMDDTEYWSLVKSVWTRQELNTAGDRKQNWKQIFSYRPAVDSLKQELQESFTAYRAGEADGFSWTLKEEIAKWFQQRFAQEFGTIPLIKKKFAKKDALFYTNDRGEEEVVIIPRL